MVEPDRRKQWTIVSASVGVAALVGLVVTLSVVPLSHEEVKDYVFTVGNGAPPGPWAHSFDLPADGNVFIHWSLSNVAAEFRSSIADPFGDPVWQEANAPGVDSGSGGFVATAGIYNVTVDFTSDVPATLTLLVNATYPMTTTIL